MTVEILGGRLGTHFRERGPGGPPLSKTAGETLPNVSLAGWGRPRATALEEGGEEARGAASWLQLDPESSRRAAGPSPRSLAALPVS